MSDCDLGMKTVANKKKKMCLWNLHPIEGGRQVSKFTNRKENIKSKNSSGRGIPERYKNESRMKNRVCFLCYLGWIIRHGLFKEMRH